MGIVRLWKRTTLGLSVGAVVAAVASATLLAAYPGTIWTSDGNGVQTNVFTSKGDVYFAGGPDIPDGNYYFQVTNLSGSTLLSTDAIACRQVTVSGGVIATASGAACQHNNGTLSSSSGSTPVRLMPYNDTNSSGGDYKVWFAPVSAYGRACDFSFFGFCGFDSKTYTFKVQVSNTSYVTVCKFSDLDSNGIQDSGEPLVPHWPITVTGVDQSPDAQTTDTGCVTFSFTPRQGDFGAVGYPRTVTLTEGTVGPDWTQTAPADDTDASDGITVSGGVITVVFTGPGQNLTAPAFGNHFAGCTDTCNPNALIVTKDASPEFTRTYRWTIDKSVDNTQIKTAGSATFNYTVSVEHDAGTDSGWKVAGTIRVSNPLNVDLTNVDVTDSLPGWNCTITDLHTGVTILKGDHRDFAYVCTGGSGGTGTNSATATDNTHTAAPDTGTADFDFSTATPTIVDGTVSVTDTFAGALGTVTYSDVSPRTFTYSRTISGDPAGTCTTHSNTATFTVTDTQSSTPTTGSDSQDVRVCVGANLEVTKTATPSLQSAITKNADKTTITIQGGGTARFNYTVTETNSAWAVTGTISVRNPNDFESVVANVSDALNNGGTCTVTGGTGVSIGAGATVTLGYGCTYASAPSANTGTNTATAAWDKNAAGTPANSASGTAGFTFGTVLVTDTMQGTLGTVNGNTASTTFTYARDLAGIEGGCTSFPNIANIPGKSANKTVQVCRPVTGAHTIGFWRNSNGEAVILNGASTKGVCNSGKWLLQFNPFKDLSSSATCAQVTTYVDNIIDAANASGASMNAMLKAQMLATALSVYFSDPALGGNAIGAPGPVGPRSIDLTKICQDLTCAAYENSSSVFGGTPKTVMQMLTYAASQSTTGGSTWYANNKTNQELAKDAFDAINNNKVFFN